MNLFLNKYSDFIARYWVIKVVVVCLCVVAIYQQTLIRELVNNRQTVIIPVGMNKEIKLTNNEADSAYIIEISRKVLDLYASISAGNVDAKLSELLTLAAPEAFQGLKSKFKQRSDLVKRYSSISYYAQLPDVPKIEFTSKEIRLNSVLRKIIGTEIDRGKTVTYKIDYRIDYGKFQLIDINEIKEKL